MLVLSRRLNESIMIGDEIELFIVEIVPGKVKIGIDAPSYVEIDREEVRDRKAREGANRPRPDEGE